MGPVVYIPLSLPGAIGALLAFYFSGRERERETPEIGDSVDNTVCIIEQDAAASQTGCKV